MNDRYLYRAKRKNWRELPEEKWWVEGNIVWSDDADDDYKAIIIPTTGSNMFTKGGSGGDLGFEKWYRVDPSTICQCTGLKDKNGKLIFEHDIVSDECGNVAEIIWNDAELQYLVDYEFEPMALGEWCSVVGNIFDNPELLE